MIMYKEVDGVLEPTQYGKNIVPNGNFDKVIQVPEEIARQANKFDFDGSKLIRKEGQTIHTIEVLNELESQYEKESGISETEPSDEEIEIVF